MNVEVTLNDGSKLFPSFDPEHKQAVLDFYRGLVFDGKIRGYIIRDNADKIMAVAF